LDEAVYLALSGRQGPVLVDVPFDIQTADIEPCNLIGYLTPERNQNVSCDFDILLSKLRLAKRPVLLVGGGVRCSGAEKEVISLIEKMEIPTVVTWSGFDLIPESHPCYRGQIGVYGSRSANLVLQNSDFMLSIGSRLDSRQTGGKYKSFAREAFKVIVDIDQCEIDKGRVVADQSVCCDAKLFIQSLEKKWGIIVAGIRSG